MDVVNKILSGIGTVFTILLKVLTAILSIIPQLLAFIINPSGNDAPKMPKL